MSKADSLRSDLRRAIERLDSACDRLAKEAGEDSLLRDGMLQRFEFCFELAWKTVQAAAADEGVSVRSPKTSLAHALQSGWISDSSLWFRMLEARNLTTHTYNEKIAKELATEIPGFLPALKELAAGVPS